MKGFFRKLFNIYPGEEKKALLFAALGFLWALGVTAGLKYADALFLLHVGAESLPLTYKLIACSMIVLASFLLYAFNTYNVHKIFITVLSIGITFYLFACFCLLNNMGIENKWLWFALRIFGSLLFSVVVSCFWTFVDQYHHLQDAKRLYGLFSSTIFLGVACTGVIMRTGIIDFQHLTLVIAAILFVTIVLITNIVSKTTPIHDESSEISPQNENTLWSQLKSILTSRFTLLLMTGNFLTFVLMVTTEFNYLSSFDHHFDSGIITATGDEQNAQLTHFMGQCLAAVSVSNLIFGLFFYSRLVRRFGIGALVICTPLLLLFMFSGWIVSDSLIFPVIGVFVVEGTLYVIDDSNFNLLLNAVPSKQKYKIRLAIESFFEPSGMLISSILLSISWIDSRILGLILSSCLLTVVLLLKWQYLKAIYLNLAENAIHFQRSVQDWFFKMNVKEKKAAEKRLLNYLKHGDEREQLLAVEALLTINDTSILEQILCQIDRLKTSGRMKFIEKIEQSPVFVKKLLQWAEENPPPSLQGAIQFYLAKQGLIPHEKAIEFLRDSDPVLQGAGVIALRKSEEASKKLQDLLNSQDDGFICIGLKILALEPALHNFEMAVSYLKHASLEVARTAAACTAQIADSSCREHAPALLHALTTFSDSEARVNCLKTLGKMNDVNLTKDVILTSLHFRPNELRQTETILFQAGLPIVPILLSITKDTDLHDKYRLLAGKVLGRLSLPQLRAHLSEIISEEIEAAYFFFCNYHTVQKNNPEYDLTILTDALLSGYHSVLDFIIQILSVAGEVEDSELLSRSLRSPHPKIRSQVLETLEKTCETKIFRLLEPLVNEAPAEEKIRLYYKRGGKAMELPEILDWLGSSPAQLDQIVSATLKQRLNLSNWRETLIKQMSNKEEIFHHFAYELLES